MYPIPKNQGCPEGIIIGCEETASDTEWTEWAEWMKMESTRVLQVFSEVHHWPEIPTGELRPWNRQKIDGADDDRAGQTFRVAVMSWRVE